ncbi:hypothetical protein [Bacillus clarus]
MIEKELIKYGWSRTTLVSIAKSLDVSLQIYTLIFVVRPQFATLFWKGGC